MKNSSEELKLLEQEEKDYLEVLIRRRARKSISSFAQYIQADYQSYKHAQVICSYLDKFASGEIKRLMIFAPPQHGKSHHSSVLLPAFLLGQNPNAKVLTVSYGQDLASGFNTQVQNMIDNPAYRSVFPNTLLGGSNVRTLASKPKRNSDMFEIVGHKGMYSCAGRGGIMTGKGFHFIIVDDLIKSRSEADSQTYRDDAFEFFEGTLYSRRTNDRTGIIILNTRWHEDDVCGRLLTKAAKNLHEDQWTILRLPRICEDPDAEGEFRQAGEVLCPELFSLEDAISQKGRSAYEWNSQQQQTPKAREGNLIKYEWLCGRNGERILKERPRGNVSRVRYWDLAGSSSKKADYTAGALIALSTDKLAYLEHVRRGQWTIHERNQHILQVARDDRDWCLKNGSSEPQVYFEKPIGVGGEDMERELRQLLIGFPVHSDPPRGSKESRANAAGGFISYAEGGNFRMIEDSEGDRWNYDFIEEATAFDNATNDDQVDAVSGGFNHVSAPVEPDYFSMNFQ